MFFKKNKKITGYFNYDHYNTGKKYYNSFHIGNELLCVSDGYIEDTAWKTIKYLNKDKKTNINDYKDIVSIQNNLSLDLNDIHNRVKTLSNCYRVEIKEYNPHNDLGNSVYDDGLYNPKPTSYPLTMNILASNEMYLLATDRPDKLNYERVSHYLDKISNGDDICGIALYVGNNRSIILDGHHRVQASFLMKIKIEMITLYFNEKSSMNLKFEPNYKVNNIASKFRGSIYEVDVPHDHYNNEDYLYHFRYDDSYLQTTLNELYNSNKVIMANPLKVEYLLNYYKYEIFKFFFEKDVENEESCSKKVKDYIDNALDYTIPFEEFFEGVFINVDLYMLYKQYNDVGELESSPLNNVLKEWFDEYNLCLIKIEEEKTKIKELLNHYTDDYVLTRRSKDEKIEIAVNDCIDITDYISTGEVVSHFDINDEGVYVLVENTKQSNKQLFGYRILIFTNNLNYVESVDIGEGHDKIHYLRVLSNKTFLTVNARCKYLHGVGAEKNATLYDEFGSEINKFTLGDGIEDIREWKDGLLMVSYYDEGVFGNYGWGEVYDGKTVYPLGKSGVVLWNTNGEIIWRYTSLDGYEQICDCYAMNLDNNDNIWFQYYTEFKLVKIDSDFNLTYYDVEFGGGYQIIIHNDLILAFAGYNKDYFILSRFSNNNVEKLFNVIFKTEFDKNISSYEFMKRTFKSKLGFYVQNRIYIYDLKTEESIITEHNNVLIN